jgi:pimeloyl-ACP methyl ester carboxylesterase
VEWDVRFFSHDGLQIAYTISDGDGPPVLIVPNWFTNIELLGQVSAFPDLFSPIGASCRLAMFDYPGTGSSDPISLDPLPPLDFWVGLVEAVLDMLGWDRASLMGFDIAGPVLLAFAAQHPDRVSSILLLNASANPGRGEPPRFSIATLSSSRGRTAERNTSRGWRRAWPATRE